METYRSGHNGADSKSVCLNGHVGSNPTVSAMQRPENTAFSGFYCGGEGGIRTLETLLTPTRFPIVRARPDYATSPSGRGGKYELMGLFLDHERYDTIKREKSQALFLEKLQKIIGLPGVPQGAELSRLFGPFCCNAPLH